MIPKRNNDAVCWNRITIPSISTNSRCSPNSLYECKSSRANQLLISTYFVNLQWASSLTMHNLWRSQNQEHSEGNTKIHRLRFRLSLFLSRFIMFKSLISSRTLRKSTRRVSDPDPELRRGLKLISIKVGLMIHHSPPNLAIPSYLSRLTGYLLGRHQKIP